MLQFNLQCLNSWKDAEKKKVPREENKIKTQFAYCHCHTIWFRLKILVLVSSVNRSYNTSARRARAHQSWIAFDKSFWTLNFMLRAKAFTFFALLYFGLSFLLILLVVILQNMLYWWVNKNYRFSSLTK